MKKVLVFLSFTFCMTAISCTDKSKEKETKTEVIKPAKVEKTKPDVIVKEVEPAKKTTISVGKNGAKVETDKVNVEVKK